MRIGRLAIVCFSAACVNLHAAETIMVAESRPLSKLAVQLEDRYGYPITYEEAPYDADALARDVRPNGSVYLRPKFRPLVFDVPENASLTDVVNPLVDQYNMSGNPGRFAALFEGGYAHIVPACGGKGEFFEPILSTRVSFTFGGRCGNTLDALFDQIFRLRGVRIAKAVIPVGPLITQTCIVDASDLPAREVLASILDQMGNVAVSRGSAAKAKPQFTWGLLYDANTTQYFLSTSMLRNPIVDSRVPAAQPSVPLNTLPSGTEPSGGSMVSIPINGTRK